MVDEDRLSESAKNPHVAGSRIIKRADARQVYDNNLGCFKWVYPLQEAHDLALFAYVEKRRSSDVDRPCVTQSHPDVELYLYLLDGDGAVVLGGADSGFDVEEYPLAGGDVLVVPRDMPYRLTGEWNGLMFHPKNNVFGRQAGSAHFPHPIRVHDVPERPTDAEREGLFEPGTVLHVDAVWERAVEFPPSGRRSLRLGGQRALRADVEVADQRSVNALYAGVTPQEWPGRAGQQDAPANAQVTGPRVLRLDEARELYNPNAGLREWLYPVGSVNDLSIVDYIKKSADSDKSSEFDSHAHPPIQEVIYVTEGSGRVVYGVGDPTFEEETYAFEAGDLLIEPTDIPHKLFGGWEALAVESRTNVFGASMGTSRFCHSVLIYDKPARATQAERDQLFDPGTYFFTDATNTFNLFAPTPYVKKEEAWPDLDEAEIPGANL